METEKALKPSIGVEDATLAHLKKHVKKKRSLARMKRKLDPKDPVKESMLRQKREAAAKVAPRRETVKHGLSMELGPEQKWLLQRATSRVHGSNLMIQGPAGSGKSVLLQHIKKSFDEMRNGMGQPMVSLVLAPTGLAALNVSGSTMHSGLKMPRPGTSIKSYKKWLQSKVFGAGAKKKTAYDSVSKWFSSINALIIDEISMVSAEQLEEVDELLREFRLTPQVAFGGCKVIAFGDLLQLPPVSTESDKRHYVIQSKSWSRWRFEVYELTSQYRQAGALDFSRLLQRCARATSTMQDLKTLQTRVMKDEDIPVGVTRLYVSNSKVKEYNNSKMEGLNGQVYTWKASWDFQHRRKLSGNMALNFAAEAEKVLKKVLGRARDVGEERPGTSWMQPTFNCKLGSRVMLRINESPQEGLVNGLCGTVRSVAGDGSGVKVCWSNGLSTFVAPYTFEIPVKKFNGYVAFTQMPLTLAWAMTIHKAQGLTLRNGVAVDPSWAPNPGQMYVALSRVTGLQNLFLLKDPDLDQFKASEVVIKFLNGLKPVPVEEVSEQEIERHRELRAQKPSMADLGINMKKKTKRKKLKSSSYSSSNVLGSSFSGLRFAARKQ